MTLSTVWRCHCRTLRNVSRRSARPENQPRSCTTSAAAGATSAAASATEKSRLCAAIDPAEITASIPEGSRAALVTVLLDRFACLCDCNGQKSQRLRRRLHRGRRRLHHVLAPTKSPERLEDLCKEFHAVTVEGTGIAAKVLKSLGVNLKEARVEVEKIIGRGSGFVAVEIPFTPRAKRVLELSLEEARQLGHNYIGTEHLLLGLLREGEGVSARVLENLGADPGNIRSQVIRMVGESAEAVGAGVGGGSSGNSKMPTLEEYGTNLTKLAEDGKLDPVVGRVAQIERVTQILGRRTKNNPCLIGEPGVGKTAIAEGLAQRIASGDVPETLEGKKVVTLDMGLLVAGTKYRGEFEERLKKLMDEIKQADDIILFIDEVHTLIGAGAAEGAIDAANILKPAMARGELQCIGATTIDEYRKHIEKDPALERRFQPVQVPEPTVDETILILKGLRERYEIHHKLKYTDEALAAAAQLSYQYI
ncbi:unnamed protein product, partial [Closterium sp. NIES-53]